MSVTASDQAHAVITAGNIHAYTLLNQFVCIRCSWRLHKLLHMDCEHCCHRSYTFFLSDLCASGALGICTSYAHGLWAAHSHKHTAPVLCLAPVLHIVNSGHGKDQPLKDCCPDILMLKNDCKDRPKTVLDSLCTFKDRCTALI